VGEKKLTGESNGIRANCNANVMQTKSHTFTNDLEKNACKKKKKVFFKAV